MPMGILLMLVIITATLSIPDFYKKADDPWYLYFPACTLVGLIVNVASLLVLSLVGNLNIDLVQQAASLGYTQVLLAVITMFIVPSIATGAALLNTVIEIKS